MQVLNQNFNISAPNEKNKFLFWSVFVPSFCDYRSMKLLRLFSGNLPAMFSIQGRPQSSIAAVFLQSAGYVLCYGNPFSCHHV